MIRKIFILAVFTLCGFIRPAAAAAADGKAAGVSRIEGVLFLRFNNEKQKRTFGALLGNLSSEIKNLVVLCLAQDPRSREILTRTIAGDFIALVTDAGARSKDIAPALKKIADTTGLEKTVISLICQWLIDMRGEVVIDKPFLYLKAYANVLLELVRLDKEDFLKYMDTAFLGEKAPLRIEATASPEKKEELSGDVARKNELFLDCMKKVDYPFLGLAMRKVARAPDLDGRLAIVLKFLGEQKKVLAGLVGMTGRAKVVGDIVLAVVGESEEAQLKRLLSALNPTFRPLADEALGKGCALSMAEKIAAVLELYRQQVEEDRVLFAISRSAGGSGRPAGGSGAE